MASADGAIIKVCAKSVVSNRSSFSVSAGQKKLNLFLNHIRTAGPGRSNLCASISQTCKNSSINFWFPSREPQGHRLSKRLNKKWTPFFAFFPFVHSASLTPNSPHSFTKYSVEISMPNNQWIQTLGRWTTLAAPWIASVP